MKQNKTQANTNSVTQFLESIEDESKRNDCYELIGLMQKATNSSPLMWGDSIIGFGDYHYKYESGREGDWFKIGFSPRKQGISLYILHNSKAECIDLLPKLGKFKTGKACIYIKKLGDIDLSVLNEIITASLK